jgi:D-lactate dehydrogenase
MNEIAQTTLDNVAAWHGGTPRNTVLAASHT